MRTAALLVSFALAFPTLAGEVLIPAVYRGSGEQGTLWRTEIILANVSTENPLPVQTTITLHRRDAEPLEIRMPLAAMEVIDVDDAIFQWFSLEGGSGIVKITWAEPNARIQARARIYTVGEAGQYGQNVPAMDTSALKTDHSLIGLTGVNGNRTNVGVSNPWDEEVLFWVTLHDTSGLSRGSFRTAVPPRSFVQFNDIFNSFQAGPLQAAMVRVSAATKPVYAYASVVRNDTGDATFVMSP